MTNQHNIQKSVADANNLLTSILLSSKVVCFVSKQSHTIAGEVCGNKFDVFCYSHAL